jgi:glycosyltransferase involved in cell wall biosynthesis
MAKDKKRRVLVLADSPTCATGFATVTRNVLKNIYDTGRYEIDMIGINYTGTYSRDEFADKYYYLNKLVPAKHPASGDLYGREYALQVLEGRMSELQPPWDIFFTIHDLFILEAKSATSGWIFSEAIKKMQRNTLLSEKARKFHFSWVGYYPVDGKIKRDWVDNSIALCDYPVAYCNFGKREIMRFASKENRLSDRLSIIKHGTNTSDFYPKPNRKQLRKKYFKDLIDDDTYLIINVNRNQIRKDMLRTFQVYKKFKQIVPNSFLYLHCKPNDLGGNIFDIAKMIGLDEGDFAVPVNFSEHIGVPISTVNDLYNCADAVITTTLGEGWGLSITEAMATKTPVIMPSNTMLPEFITEELGWLSKSGTNPSLFTVVPIDNEIIRPLVDVDDMVKKMLDVYNNRDEAKVKVEKHAFDEAEKYDKTFVFSGVSFTRKEGSESLN